MINEVKPEKKISPIFLSNGRSSTLIIPTAMAQKYGMIKNSYVVLEDVENGVLIKPLDLED